MSATAAQTPRRDLMVAALILITVALMRGPLLELFSLVTPGPLYMKGGDYPAFWLAEQQLARGAAASLYDRAEFAGLMRDSFGPEYAKGRWLYPPHFLFVLAPLAALPYALGWLAFMAAGFAAFIASLRRAFPGEPRLLFLGALAPAVIANLILGQTGFLASALLLGGLALRLERPLLAGALFGLLTMKPHLGLLVPFILLFEGNWRAIAAAAATTLGLMLASGLVFGFDLWMAYLRDLLGGDQKAMLDFVTGNVADEMASLYSLARSVGAGHGAALGLQALLALSCVAAAWQVSRRALDGRVKLAIYVCLAMLVSPYMMVYDLPGLAAVALAVAIGAAGRFDAATRAAAWAVYAFPIVQIVASAVFAPIGALASLGFAGLLLIRGRTPPAP